MGIFNIKFNQAKKAVKYDDVAVIYPPSLVDNKVLDMTDDEDKKDALKYVAPLSYVVSRIGSMASDGKPYVVDKDNNEIQDATNKAIRDILNNPNPMQDFSQFTKAVEMYVKLHGFCPLYLVRATSESPIKYIIPLPPEDFRIENCPDIMQLGAGLTAGKAFFNCDNKEIELEPYEYHIVHDGMFNVVNGNLEFFSPVSALSDHVKNYIGQLKARGNLIYNGGGKGIIYGNDTSEFGNLELTPQEKEDINRQFNDKCGLVGKSPILVTRAKVGWQSLSFDVDQLKLHEEDTSCMKDIANAIGINPNLFISDSTFQNQEAVKKSAYQDVIIPDANRLARALTNILCPEGIYVKIDYSHVPCLQEDLSASALALKNMAIGLKTLIDNNLISRKEARIEISKYLDINPNETE